ncbi:hypothetical protein U1Q18_026180, partial [Sarracenia purpurea var. burkii]
LIILSVDNFVRDSTSMTPDSPKKANRKSYGRERKATTVAVHILTATPKEERRRIDSA